MPPDFPCVTGWETIRPIAPALIPAFPWMREARTERNRRFASQPRLAMAPREGL